MSKKVKLLLEDILESLILIEKYREGVSEKKFSSSSEKQDAIIRRLEIIGEAVRAISDDYKKIHPQIPWGKIVGTRNVLIHEYFGVDIDLVWGILVKELPNLRLEIERLLQTEN